MAFPEELDLSRTGSGSHPSPVELLFPLPDDAAVPALNALAEELACLRAALAAAHQRLSAQGAVARILAAAINLPAAGAAILRSLCETLDWEMGVLWNVDPHVPLLRCGDLWCSPEIDGVELGARLRQMTCAPGGGLPGRVWAAQAPGWVPDRSREAGFPRVLIDAQESLRGAVAFPLRCGPEMIGVIELLCRRSREPDPDLLLLLDALGSQIGQFAARLRAENSFQESEERYTLAGYGSNDGLWDWDLRTDHIDFSPRWKAMLGCAEGEVGSSPDEWFDRVHPDDRDRVRAELAAHLEGRSPHFLNDLRMRHQDGTYRWMLCRGVALRGESGKPVRIAGSQTDITDRKQAEEQLLHDAFHDALTGLRNRTLFIDRLGRSLRRAKQGGEHTFAVLFLDLDRFKVVNDSLGHLVGDRLLIGIARRLEACLRPGDTVARLGGDEFAILLDEIREVDDAKQVAERIHRKLTLPFQLEGHEVFTTASIGIAISASHYEQPDDLLRDADMAMYRAKALGKARHEMFDAEMHTRAVAMLQMESELRRAVERQEFLLHYQPIVSLVSGQITGVEALLRWQHPERGLVFPSEFIPLAEETGLIAALGEWLLRAACAQNKLWHADGWRNLRVLVNLAARQFQDPDLPALVSDVLQETGLEAPALQLEVTETVAMKNVDRSVATLKALHAMGVQISIDDFGTGYSSLGYLKRFPLHALKIGRSFVRQVTSDPDDAAITAAITALAHSLNLKVVAEGVETEEQLAFLRWQQCDEIQGDLFSPALPVEQFAALLQQGRCLAPVDPNVERAQLTDLMSVKTWA